MGENLIPTTLADKAANVVHRGGQSSQGSSIGYKELSSPRTPRLDGE
jgi:hypothetical protein